MKSLLAGALALALEPASFTPGTFTHHPYVSLVECDEGRGTAFQIAPGKFLSVNHVSRLTACRIGDKPVTVTYADTYGDFSTLDVADFKGGGIAIRCDGYRDGEWVFALGHAHGNPIPQIMALRYNATLSEIVGPKWAVLEGFPFKVIPGMSGGPILDSTGRVVGVVNAYSPFFPISFSRELKDTPLCSQ